MKQRPCLLLAAAYALGELLVCTQLGLLTKMILGMTALGLWLSGFLRAKKSRTVYGCLLFFVCLGGLRYQAEQTNFERCQQCLSESTEKENSGRAHYIEGVLDSWESRETGERLLLNAVVLWTEDGSQPLGRVQVQVSQKGKLAALKAEGGDGESDWRIGQRLAVSGRLRPYQAARNVGGFDGLMYARSRGLSTGFEATDIRILAEGSEYRPLATMMQEVQHYAHEALLRLAAAEDYPLFCALLLGDKTELAEETKALYRDSGLAHLLAISALHLSLLHQAAFRLCARLRLGKKSAALLSLCLIALYTLFSGASVSALRALCMLSCGLLAMSLGKSYDLLSALGLSFLALTLRQPFLIWNQGFQLSFTAVLALGLSAQLWRPRSALWQSLSASLCIQMLTLPLLLYHYFRFPLYGCLLNLAALPLMGYLMYSLLLALLCAGIYPPAAQLFGGMAHYILRFYELLSRLSLKLPFAQQCWGRPGEQAILVYYLLLLGVYCLLRYGRKMAAQASKTQDETRLRRWRALGTGLSFVLCGLALSLLPVRAPSGLQLDVLDVGQGDGLVLRVGGQTISIDMGSSSERKLGEYTLKPYFASQGIQSLTAAFVSHADADHTNGLSYLLQTKQLRLETLYLPEPARTDERYEPLISLAEAGGSRVCYLAAGDELQLGELHLSCMSPEAERPAQPLSAEAAQESKEQLSSTVAVQGGKEQLSSAMAAQGGKEQLSSTVAVQGSKLAASDTAHREQRQGGASTDSNAHSLALWLQYGRFDMLLTGDMGAAQEAQLLRRLPASFGRGERRLELLKVAHHGSRSSSSAPLLDRLRPLWALISSGRNNRYGHPHREVLERLEAAGCIVMGTAEEGQLRIRCPQP